LLSTLLLLRHLMKRIAAIEGFATEWRTRIIDHLRTSPAVPNALDLMGLTATWDQHPIWA